MHILYKFEANMYPIDGNVLTVHVYDQHILTGPRVFLQEKQNSCKLFLTILPLQILSFTTSLQVPPVKL